MTLFWPWTRPREDRHHLLSDLLNRNGRWIEVADAKAAAMLVFVTAVAGFLVEPSFKTAKKLATAQIAIGTTESATTGVVFSLLLLSLIAAAFYTIRHVLMALDPSLARKRAAGYVFFRDIAGRDLADLEKKLLESQSTILERDLVEQIHTTAIIALAKHQHVRKAIRGMSFTVGFGLVVYAGTSILG